MYHVCVVETTMAKYKLTTITAEINMAKTNV